MKTSSQRDKILDYLDGKLSPAEQQEFEKVLSNDAQLRKQLDEIREMEGAMKQLRPEQPAKNFTDLVMANLDNYPATSGLSVRNGIFLLAGVMIVAGICVLLLSAGVFDSTRTTIDLNEIGVQSKYIKQSLPAIPLDGKLIVNVIIFLNLALAFLVLDRTVLKPLFRRRMSM